MSALPAPLTVTTPAATGAAYAHGAHVVGWTPQGHEPVLWLSPRTELTSEKAIRGGVPVCFPWFGPGRDGDRSPAHGFARTSRWRVVEHDGDRLAFELTQDDVADDHGWSHPFVARLTATFADVLTVTLAVSNPGREPLDVEAALHTYLAVGDVRQVRVRGLHGVRYVDKTDGGAVREQSGDVVLVGEVDRVYDAVTPVQVHDPVLGRTLHVSSDGATRTVVWNPGEAKAAGMADVEGWERFVAVEAANALDGFVTIAPGGTHELTQRVAVA